MFRLILLKMTSLVRNREMVSEVISYCSSQDSTCTSKNDSELSVGSRVVKSDRETTALMFELILLGRGVLHG